MRLANVAGLVALFALAGCGAVKVTTSGSDVKAEAKPSDCGVEFLKVAPERAFDELGELQSHVTNVPRAGPLEVLREQACKLGADAVIVTRNFVTNAFGHVLVAGTAIKYREAAPAPPPSQEAAPAPPPSQEPSRPLPGTVNL